MVEHTHYYQEKFSKDKNEKISTCELKLSSDEDKIYYSSKFYDNFLRIQVKNSISFQYKLTIDKKNGDIEISYQIENNNGEKPWVKSGNWTKKNDFNRLDGLCDRGFYYGEKRKGFWGNKYKKETNKIIQLIREELKPNINSDYLLKKDYQKYEISPFYDMIVDYHLYMRGIKHHDNVYTHIMTDYPKKKWLKENDNKFLPAVLDNYVIKSKYLIGELSFEKNKNIDIKCLNYLCKLFGENYMDYIKRFNCQSVCRVYFKPRRYHQCKNDFEKNSIVNLIINWYENEERLDNPIVSIYELFNLRTFLEDRGYNLKLKFKTTDDYDVLMQEWSSIKKYLTVGYKLRYNIPQEIIDDIEKPIIIENRTYNPKVLLSEDDYNIEGIKMKNCMGKQFSHGVIFIYVSLTHNKRRINLQYRRGTMMQAYGKANTPITKELFDEPIDILTKRLLKYENLSWKREKYLYLNK